MQFIFVIDQKTYWAQKLELSIKSHDSTGGKLQLYLKEVQQ